MLPDGSDKNPYGIGIIRGRFDSPFVNNAICVNVVQKKNNNSLRERRIWAIFCNLATTFLHPRRKCREIAEKYPILVKNAQFHCLWASKMLS